MCEKQAKRLLLIDGNLSDGTTTNKQKKWWWKQEKYLVFYIITRREENGEKFINTNWNVFLVFSLEQRCGLPTCARFVLHMKKIWKASSGPCSGRRIIDNIFRVLIYVIFFVFKMPYYNHKHFSSSNPLPPPPHFVFFPFLCKVFLMYAGRI